MFRFIKNDDGIALIMVLILLILVGGLTAALMAAGVFNIRFGVDEVDRTQAFYAADAGVEYTKNTLRKMGSNNNLDGFEDTGWIDFDEKGYSEFKVERLNPDENDLLFMSTGKFNGVEREIEFSFDIESFYELAVLLNDPDGESSKEGLTNWRGSQGGDFSYDNISLANLNDWWDFLDPNNNDTTGDYNENGFVYYDNTDGSYIKSDKSSVIDYLDFIPVLAEEITSTSDIEDIEDEYYNEDEHGQYEEWQDPDKLFFTKNRVEIDPDGVEKWEEIDSEYEEGDVLYEEGYIVHDDQYYYIANQNITTDHDYNIPPDDSDYWDLIDDEDDLVDLGLRGNITIKDKIIIVNGSLDVGSLGNINIIRSLILVRNTVQMGGNTNLEESLIIAFNEGNEEEALTVTGAPSIDLELLSSSTIEEDWYGIRELLDELDAATDLAKMNYWRQKN